MGNNFINKVLDVFGMGDEIERIDEEEINSAESEQLEVISNNKRGKVVSIHSTSNAKVVIVQPTQYEEITNICDCLKNRKIVLANLQKLDPKLAQRFVDFASGAAYALDGSIQEISPGILLLTPNNVDVSSDFKEELSAKNIFSWADR
ncbi:cell division protein SepF [Oxobacter pfennigii]|uniref:Cell division protein SepF n=1 Tax=Oxobacter pfennigii TaxID=36849 RepID=A0A0P8W7G9_9CLOT|nr:cell division protein SepF [Oxobacter pfennigii]KPU43998.1 cell division protein SepF [Oxobacter pfennigii]